MSMEMELGNGKTKGFAAGTGGSKGAGCDSQREFTLEDTLSDPDQILLEDGKAKTLEEIGRHFFVTRKHIRQIEARALHELCQPYRNHNVKCYVNDI